MWVNAEKPTILILWQHGPRQARRRPDTGPAALPVVSAQPA